LRVAVQKINPAAAFWEDGEGKLMILLPIDWNHTSPFIPKWKLYNSPRSKDL
jgi:hypothetical protein